MTIKHVEALKNSLLNITQQALKQVEGNPRATQKVEQEHEKVYKALENFDTLANDIADVMKMTMTYETPTEEELDIFNEKTAKLFQLTQDILEERKEEKTNGNL